MAQKNKISGFLAGLLILLFTILLLAMNWKTISQNMQETNFIEKVFQKENTEEPAVTEKPVPRTIEQPETAQKPVEKPEPLVPPKQTEPNSSDFLTVGTPEKPKTPETATQNQPPQKPVQTVETQNPAATGTTQGGQQQIPVKTPVKTQETSLFFVIIDSGGAVVRKEIKRSLPVSDSPLSDTIRALLSGPQRQETEKGFISLIPAGTELLSATVQNGTATLNFSEKFEFNSFGTEGYYGQLMQIVFTATAYPTVSNVQFLIEGERKEYLGSEGVWIGSPVSRTTYWQGN